MNRESFNLNINNPEEVIKDLNDLKSFDSEELDTLKEEDPEAYYRLMEKLADKEEEKHQKDPLDYSGVSPEKRVVQVTGKKSSKNKKDEDSVYRKKHVDYSQWLREH